MAVAASHGEVYNIVRARNLLDAAALFSLAHELADGGDNSLLVYCTGATGKAKRNLQKLVDAIWQQDVGLPSQDASGDPISQAHARPLTTQRLLELRSEARGGSLPLASSRQDQCGAVCLPPAAPATLNCRRRVDKIAELKAHFASAAIARQTTPRGGVKLPPLGSSLSLKASAAKRAPLLLDFRAAAAVVFRPRQGVWRMRDVYELLVACRAEPALAGVRPSSAPEGGLTVPRSAAAWTALQGARGHGALRCGGKDEGSRPQAELRFSRSCVGMRLHAANPQSVKIVGAVDEAATDEVVDMWVDDMPKDSLFDENKMTLFPLEERLVRLTAWKNVEEQQVLAVLRAVERLGHSVCQTSGFSVKGERLLSTSTASTESNKMQSGKVPFGISCAQACLAGGTGVKRRLALSASRLGRSGQVNDVASLRPAPASGGMLALAAAALGGSRGPAAEGPAALKRMRAGAVRAHARVGALGAADGPLETGPTSSE